MLSTAFLLAASMVVGQAGGGMPEDIRQHIDKHIIGQWTSQTKWGEKEAQGEFTSRWTRGQTCVLSESIGKDFDGRRVSSTAILGWDAKQKCMVEFTISSKGENWIIRWTDLTAEEWTGHGSGLYEGSEWSSAAKIQWTEDGARYEDTTGGKPFVIVSKRKEGRAAAVERDKK